MQKQFKQVMRCYRRLITLSANLILALLFISTATLACQIKLKPFTVISNNTVTIRDIANNYPKKYANVELCPAPFINNSITLTQTYIKSLLANKGLHFSLCGSRTTVVKTKAFLLTKQKILKIIGLKNAIFITKLPIKLPPFNYQTKLKNITYSKNIIFYTISLYKQHKIYKNLTIALKKPFDGRLLPVASKDIYIGQIISASDITFKNIKHIPPNALLYKPSIINRVAVTFIREGSSFTLSNTRRYKPVKMGDLVKVKITEGNIHITTVAKALRGGYKGDIIPIMYLSSKRVRPAIIIGKREVTVQ